MLIGGRDDTERAAKIITYDKEHGGVRFALPISLDSDPVQPSDTEIDDTIRLAPDGPGIVLFTSGTTGRAKGAILPRACFTRTKLAQPGKVAISYYPAHWIGGARTLIISVLTGKKVYALGESYSARSVLETLKNHRITQISFSPRLLSELKDLLVDQTGKVPQGKQDEYASWFRGLHELRCSGGVIEPPTKRFWTDLTDLPFRNIYAGTELGSPVIMTQEGQQAMVRSHPMATFWMRPMSLHLTRSM
jgi:malonyl-CoA/methylmalonyl-CoA synthetase